MWRTDRRQNPASSTLMAMRRMVTTDGKKAGLTVEGRVSMTH